MPAPDVRTSEESAARAIATRVSLDLNIATSEWYWAPHGERDDRGARMVWSPAGPLVVRRAGADRTLMEPKG